MPFRDDIRSVPVPGCVDGWVALHERFGRLPLADVLGTGPRTTPSDGFPATPSLAAAASRSLDLPGRGRLPPAGSCTPGDRGPPARGGPRPGRHRRRRPGAASTRASSARACSRWAAASTPPTTSPAHRPTGSSPSRLDAWGRDALDRAAQLAGLPHPRRRPGSPTGSTCPPTPTTRCGPTSPSRRPGRRATTGSTCSTSTPTAPPCSRPSGSAPAGCAIDPDARRGPRRRRTGDGRHDLPLRRRRRPHGRVADPVQRRRLRARASSSPASRIFLQNRGIGFSLDRGHPAEYGPGRRPPHTLSPGARHQTRRRRLDMVIGTMGGDSQPQILLQLLARLLATRPVARRGHRRGPLGAGRSPAAAPGFDTWDDGRPRRRSQLEGHAPAVGRGPARSGATREPGGAVRPRLRPRPRHRVDERPPRRRRRPHGAAAGAESGY